MTDIPSANLPLKWQQWPGLGQAEAVSGPSIGSSLIAFPGPSAGEPQREPVFS